MRAGIGEEARGRLFGADAGAVAAIGDHGVECIHHGDDARTHRYLVSTEPPRVAAAIHLLVVMQREEAGQVQVGKQPQDGPAILGMEVHHRALLRRQRSRLVEDGVGYTDLAEIVEEARHLDVALIRFVEAELDGDAHPPFGEACAVAAGVEVAQVLDLVEPEDH